MNGSWSWRRSSFSDAAGNQCVEVACTGRDVLVRDSKDTTEGLLTFSVTAWGGFVEAAEAAPIAPACG
ncbi:DUF397 domain-containing protein [Streptomyces sp. M41(2017)]|uniref:DUF397 domain-containing protein n=1 Tax=unclassified Streptomyces TaxID=2593676 RepID=UPI0009BCA048|nr:DUF397 domain-containing protein [Streptomyces sp. M41(2017)]OQQ13683.1 hypothetical protein B0675_25785 [Streptomyces sp. M41(2017)]